MVKNKPEQNVANLELFVRLIVTNKDGVVESDTGEMKAKSFTLQFLKMLYNVLGGPEHATNVIADITNTGRYWTSFTNSSADLCYNFMSMFGYAGSTTAGIVVGTGSGAESNTNYALTSIIAHGTSGNQFSYGATSFSDAAIVGSNVDFILSRSFYNGSGASITVNEIGIHTYYGNYLTRYTFLAVRDLTTVAVADTKTLTVTYTFRTAV